MHFGEAGSDGFSMNTQRSQRALLALGLLVVRLVLASSFVLGAIDRRRE